MRISEYISRFEKVIVAILSVMMAVVIALATIDLGWALVESILSPPILLLSVQELIDIFGLLC
jgi:hypothetical protein